MRQISILFTLVFSTGGVFAQIDESTTLLDPVATLDLTTVSGEPGDPRPLVIRQEAVQQFHTPAIESRTVQRTANETPRLPSVDTISGAEIRTFQRYGIEDILRHSAGVSMVSAGQTGSQTSLFIRGMESNHTVVLLNGRRLPPGLAGIYQLEFLDTSNLESVQLIRGAASSLYGSDALAGALDLRSTDARYVHANTLSSYVEGGSFETFRTGQKITVREGAVGLALDASYLDSANDRPFSEHDNATVRGNFAYEIAEGVQFDILGYIQNAFGEVPGSSLSAAFPDGQIYRNQSGLFSPRFSLVRDEWDFSTFYSYTTNELEATRDLFFLDNLLEQTGHEFEAQFTYRPGATAAYTIGGGHYDYSFERIPLIPGPFNNPAAFDYAFTSVFAQADVGLPANFHLLASGRYDDHDSFESRATYTVQLSHEIEPTGTMLFAKAATGYKAPSGQDFIFLDPSLDPATILPEESLTREAGVRQTLFNERSSVSLTYFWNDVDNLVDVDPFTFIDPAIVDTESEGVEVELVLSPCEGLNLYTNYTWLNAHIVDGEYLGGFGGSPGDRLTRRPAHTLSAGVLASGDHWTLGAEISGAYDRLDAPGVFLDDYTVARLFGSLQMSPRVELYGRFENVFDLDYEHTTGFEAAGFGAFVGVRVLVGQ